MKKPNRKPKAQNVNAGNNSDKGGNRCAHFKGKDYKPKGKDSGITDEYGRYSDPKGNNDVAWYDRNPSMLQDAANLPFMYPAGTEYTLNVPFGATFPGYPAPPTLLTLQLAPTIGATSKPTDPINIAAMAQFTYVRKNKAGNLPFDAPDLMMFTLAMADVYSYINYLFRAYSIVQLYTMSNPSIPDTLLAANFIDAQDLRQNLSDFRYGVNLLIDQAAAAAVPANVTLYSRRAFLYQNLYTEGTSIKDQMYMYVPDGFYTFNEGASAPSSGVVGTNLVYTPFANNKSHTVKELIAYGENMISALYNSADVQSMSAFNLEAYGTDGIIKLQTLPEISPIVPTFNIGVLEQMRNATILPKYPDTAVGTALYSKFQTSLNIIQEQTAMSYITSQPTIYMPASSDIKSYSVLDMYRADKILSTTTDDTSAGLIMESSRLMLAGDVYTAAETVDEYNTLTIKTGSEVAVNVTVWRLNPSTGAPVSHLGLSYVSTPNFSFTGAQLRPWMTEIKKFKFYPTVYLFDFSSGNVMAGLYRVDDVDNFTIIDNTRLQMLHEIAMLSLLDVPRVGKL